VGLNSRNPERDFQSPNTIKTTFNDGANPIYIGNGGYHQFQVGKKVEKYFDG
jgi:hypothetical protein